MDWIEKLKQYDLEKGVKFLSRYYMVNDYERNSRKKSFPEVLKAYKELNLTLDQYRVITEYYLHIGADVSAENRSLKRAISYISEHSTVQYN